MYGTAYQILSVLLVFKKSIRTVDFGELLKCNDV